MEDDAGRGATGGLPVKTGPIPLRPAMPISEAAYLILADCVNQLRVNAGPFCARRDPEALHQSHVASRRIRTALQIFRRRIGKRHRTLWSLISERVRALASVLGAARDHDVVLSRYGDDEGVRLRLGPLRDAAHARAVRSLQDAENRHALDRLLALSRNRSAWRSGGAGTLAEFASATLGRLRRRLLKAGRDLEHADPRQLHRLRLRAKRMRYAAGFFAALYRRRKQRRRRKAMVERLTDLQSHLGDLNDLTVAAALLGMRHAPAAGTDAALRTSAARSIRRLRRCKPFWA